MAMIDRIECPRLEKPLHLKKDNKFNRHGTTRNQTQLCHNAVEYHSSKADNRCFNRSIMIHDRRSCLKPKWKRMIDGMVRS
jgi:hypothetical protein